MEVNFQFYIERFESSLKKLSICSNDLGKQHGTTIFLVLIMLITNLEMIPNTDHGRWITCTHNRVFTFFVSLLVLYGLISALLCLLIMCGVTANHEDMLLVPRSCGCWDIRNQQCTSFELGDGCWEPNH